MREGPRGLALKPEEVRCRSVSCSTGIISTTTFADVTRGLVHTLHPLCARAAGPRGVQRAAGPPMVGAVLRTTCSIPTQR